MEAIGVERAQRGRAQPQVVVHRRGRRSVGLDGDVAHPVLVGPRLDQPDRAQRAAFHVVDRVGVVRSAALLRPHLDDAIVLARDVHHHAALADRQRQGLLDVDVLARLAGHHRRQRVPVVRRADDDRVDVGSVEHAAEVPGHQFGRLREVPRHQILDLRALRVIDVTERHDLRAQAQRLAQVAGAHAAATDQPHADAAVGAAHLGLRLRRDRAGQRNRRCAGQAGHRLLHEGTSGTSGHAGGCINCRLQIANCTPRCTRGAPSLPRGRLKLLTGIAQEARLTRPPATQPAPPPTPRRGRSRCW